MHARRNRRSTKRVFNPMRKSSYMAIDTEFLREKTYYAKLCLIQVAIEDCIAIIDPLLSAILR